MIIGAVVIIAIAVGAYYFTQMRPQADNSDVAVVDEVTEENNEGDATENDAMEEADVTIELGGADFRFSEEEITVTEGDVVKVVFATTDALMHDWNLDQFDAQTEISQQGETVEVTFVADEVGEYEFYCSVGNHRAQGMVGTLVVEPAE